MNLNEMITTFEMIMMAEEYSSRSFVNLHSGKIVTLFSGQDFSYVEDEDLEGDCIPEHYAPLPRKYELNEYEMMENFCYSIRNRKIQEDLLRAIQGKGAFSKFRTAIHCHSIENKWEKFREECLKKIAIEFCKHHGLTYHDSPQEVD